MSEALRLVHSDAPEAPADDPPGATAAATPAATATPADPPALMTSAELAAELQISERTVRRLQITGKIGPKPINVGRACRYLRCEARRWIEAGCPDRESWQGPRVGRRK